MKFMKRHVVNAFTFARAGKAEDGSDCIIWHNYVDNPGNEERMILDKDGHFVRLERHKVGEAEWHLAPIQGNPKAHDELLQKVKELGWSIDEVWLQPIALRGTPEWNEAV